MGKETRALTTVGGVITQAKPIPISGKTVSPATEKNRLNRLNSPKSGDGGKSTSSGDPLQFNFTTGVSSTDGGRSIPSSVSSSSQKQFSSGIKSRSVSSKKSNNKGTSSEITTAASIFIAIAIAGILAAIVIPAYQNYIATAKVANKAKQLATDTFQKARFYTDEEVSAIAAQANATLPKMVDRKTRLDSTIGVSDEFQYNYTLVDIDSESISWASLKKTLEIYLVNWVCTSRRIVEVFISKGVTVSFAYFGKDRELIGVVSVAPSQCASRNRAAVNE